MTGPRLNPVRAIRLVAGLAAWPDSLYRARVLQEQTEAGEFDSKGKDKAKPVVLPWLGWDSPTMLLADVRNTLEAWVVAQSSDGKKKRKVEPSVVQPPFYTPPREPKRGEVSAAEFVRIAAAKGKTHLSESVGA